MPIPWLEIRNVVNRLSLPYRKMVTVPTAKKTAMDEKIKYASPIFHRGIATVCKRNVITVNPIVSAARTGTPTTAEKMANSLGKRMVTSVMLPNVKVRGCALLRRDLPPKKLTPV